MRVPHQVHVLNLLAIQNILVAPNPSPLAQILALVLPPQHVSLHLYILRAHILDVHAQQAPQVHVHTRVPVPNVQSPVHQADHFI